LSAEGRERLENLQNRCYQPEVLARPEFAEIGRELQGMVL
jgi:hypothetical protein